MNHKILTRVYLLNLRKTHRTQATFVNFTWCVNFWHVGKMQTLMAFYLIRQVGSQSRILICNWQSDHSCSKHKPTSTSSRSSAQLLKNDSTCH